MLRQTRILCAVLAFAMCPAAGRAAAVTGPDGVLRYPFGEGTPPTLRCVPLSVCDLVLEPGEAIANVAIGDSVRWLIAPASSGPAETATPHVLIKPTEPGLRTNLIVTTNRRTYYLTLVSQKSDPMLRIGFLYPQDNQHVFAASLSRAQDAQRPLATTEPQVQRTPRPSPELPEATFDQLDFNYRMSGDRGLEPLRVFNDGAHTYLQMPPQMNHIPVLLAVGSDGGDTLVNYRYTGKYYVVDGVPARIALVDGSGKKQRRALIVREN
jgi:P-type conjugative transfer protein TrbG